MMATLPHNSPPLVTHWSVCQVKQKVEYVMADVTRAELPSFQTHLHARVPI